MSSQEKYQHVHPKFRHVVSLKDSERIQYLDAPRWIGYQKAQDIFDHLKMLLGRPQQVRMGNLLLIGEPNNGKTSLLKRFCKLYGDGYVNDDTEPVRPIIYAESPPTPDEKALYISILEQFITPYRARDPVNVLRYQVIHLMRECHVKMLIIDELHSLLAGTAGKQREIMNVIKLLCNELKIPIVGAGTQAAVNILHTDPQHASRFDVATLPLWPLSKDFRKLLRSFEAVLPLKKPSDLQRKELCCKIHALCGGNLGDLHCLLSESAKAAITSGKEQIDLEILEGNAWVQPTSGIRHRL